MNNKLPNPLQMAKNFVKAISKHVIGGLKRVTVTQYMERIEICNECPLRQDNRCVKCGCFIDIKAWWRSEDCPEQKWPKIEDRPIEKND